MATKYTTKLSQQRVLILGGTSGIGFCVAEAALEHGARVIIASSQRSKLDQTLARLNQSYPAQAAEQPILTHVCDLSDIPNLEANLESLLQAATDDGAVKLNHIVTTAGNAVNVPALADVTAEDIYRSMDVRLVAPSILAKYIPKYVEQSPQSSFTITGGMFSRRPHPGCTLLATVTSAIEGLARGLAHDVKPVRVNAVAPGAVLTGLHSGHSQEELNALVQRFRDGNLTGTVAQPEEVAESYIYAMKDSFLTGTVIDSSGGGLLA
ncbi:NAD(P)-binding protein [Penicillium capsulatum]|uniref:NAD(P)-binding protein n=1 Tax=Penicillium capsulatum TaxID=69766 RepID=A0A9W9HQZ1_9EURO|nr:NAD(P)-binding protein [Penicillium capsulatum]KAJ6105357.1 NAD(P)-binding protein [Penicillium capsulatum]